MSPMISQTPDDDEWELSLREIAALFALKGWQFASPELGYGIPGEDHISNLFRSLVKDIREDGRPSVMSSRGRFMAIRDANTPGSIDMYLNVGFVWDDSPIITDDEEN